MVNDLMIAPHDAGQDRTPPYQPSAEESRIISAIEGSYQDREQRKRAYEKTWFQNHAGIVGQHYLSWNDERGSFEIPMKGPSNRVRYVVNLMLPLYRRNRSRLTAHRPVLHVAPARNDEESAQIARSNLHVLEGEYERLNYSALMKERVGWGLEAGTGIMAFRWNPWAGPPLFEDQPVIDPMTGQVQVDETGAPVTQKVPVTDESGRQLHQGQTEADVLSPYELDVDPRATGPDDAQWMRRDTIRTVDWCRENYPKMGIYVKATEDVYLNNFYFKRIKQLVGVYGFTSDSLGETSRQAPKNSVIVHEYWERPTTKHPWGRLVVVAGGVLLHNGENPYRRMIQEGIWFPFSFFREIIINGRFWGMATLEQGFPINKNIDKARSQEIENRAIHGRPKTLIPKECKILQGSFTPEAGEKIYYSAGPSGNLKPEMMYPQSTTMATQAEVAHSMNDFMDVTSHHEANKGIMPSANAPAAAVDKLQTADDTALGDTESNLRDATVRDGKIILCLASEFWTEERLVRVTGEGGYIAAERIRGDQMTGDEQGASYFDVRMVPLSTMWRDPAKQRDMVKEMIEFGLLNPVEHRSSILKMLDQASVDEIFRDDQQDTQWALRENEMMAEGMLSEAQDFENHQIHILEHNRFRKSEKYRQLPPQMRQLFDQHVAMHKQLMVQVAQEKGMMQFQAGAPAVQAEAQLQSQMAPAEMGAPQEEAPPSPPAEV